jgi:hypothetical protein
MNEKIKQLNVEIKPIENADGSKSFYTVFTSIVNEGKTLDKDILSYPNYKLKIAELIRNGTITTDRDGEIIHPNSVKGLETSITSYRHNKCDGMPVDTGGTILRDSIVIDNNKVSGMINIKATDELFFCDRNSIKKQSNGKALDLLNQGKIKSVSMGFRYDTKDVEEIKVDGRSYYLYKNIMVHEVSLLDTVSSNLSSVIITKNMNEKIKCLCGAEANLFAVNTKTGQAVKLISQVDDTESWKATTFEGEETTITGDDYEVLNNDRLKMFTSLETTKTPETEPQTDPESTDSTVTELQEQIKSLKVELEKACSCNDTKKKVEGEKSTDDETPVPPIQVSEDIMNAVLSLNDTVKELKEVKSTLSDESMKSIEEMIKNLKVKEAIEANKFVKELTKPNIIINNLLN